MKESIPLLALDLTGTKRKPGAAAFAFAEPNKVCSIGTISGGPFPPEPFPLLQGESAPPQSSHKDALECLGTEDDQYTENQDGCDACVRVLCYNPPRGDKARRARIAAKRAANSYLGVNGHLERACAWIHVLGAVIFLVFATLRPITGFDITSTAGVLSGITAGVMMATFLISAAYHTVGTIGDLMPILRMMDHGIIYIALACATVTDTAVVTIDFLDVPWQTIADVMGVAFLLLFFFSYRRLVLPPSETVVAWGSCKLGLFRLQHGDKEHSALRSSGYVILSFGFICLLPAAVHNLPYELAVVLIICNTTSLAMLVAGLLLDNVLVWPDLWYQRGTLPSVKCHSTELGCICTSHAFWHLLSLMSVVLLTIGREICIANTLEGRYGSPAWKGGRAAWTITGY